jgi:phosphinothricin acetyltransferase
MDCVIDEMRPDDWEQVRSIYLQGIRTGDATFESEAPSWDRWDSNHLKECRLVARDAAGDGANDVAGDANDVAGDTKDDPARDGAGEAPKHVARDAALSPSTGDPNSNVIIADVSETMERPVLAAVSGRPGPGALSLSLLEPTKSPVRGWAALSRVSSRKVYAGVTEVSIYVAEQSRGKGIGQALLQALVAESERCGIWTLQAGIFPENAASISLHLRNGFREVGRRERLGKMHGIWRDVVLLERRSLLAGQD